jgi:hypothetical protein
MARWCYAASYDMHGPTQPADAGKGALSLPTVLHCSASFPELAPLMLNF